MKKILFLFVSIILSSCGNNDDDFTPTVSNVDYDPINETEIQTYLSDNEITAEKTASGLYYIITEEGDEEGENPSSDSNVTLAYKGYFLNGEVFDQSDNIDFSLTSLIPGFSEGAQLLKEGGSGTFILPSRLAYGNTGAGSIAPGEVIVFDIELITIN